MDVKFLLAVVAEEEKYYQRRPLKNQWSFFADVERINLKNEIEKLTGSFNSLNWFFFRHNDGDNSVEENRDNRTYRSETDEKEISSKKEQGFSSDL